MTPEVLTSAGNIAFSVASAPAGRAAGELEVVEELLLELPQAITKRLAAARTTTSSAKRKHHFVVPE